MLVADNDADIAADGTVASTSAAGSDDAVYTCGAWWYTLCITMAIQRMAYWDVTLHLYVNAEFHNTE